MFHLFSPKPTAWPFVYTKDLSCARRVQVEVVVVVVVIDRERERKREKRRTSKRTLSWLPRISSM